VSVAIKPPSGLLQAPRTYRYVDAVPPAMLDATMIAPPLPAQRECYCVSGCGAGTSSEDT